MRLGSTTKTSLETSGLQGPSLLHLKPRKGGNPGKVAAKPGTIPALAGNWCTAESELLIQVFSGLLSSRLYGHQWGLSDPSTRRTLTVWRVSESPEQLMAGAANGSVDILIHLLHPLALSCSLLSAPHMLRHHLPSSPKPDGH